MRKHLITTTLASAVISAALVAPAQADVTIASWGGAYTMSQQKAYADTYTGGNVNFINYNGGLGEVRAQVESGNVTWDIIDAYASRRLFSSAKRDIPSVFKDFTNHGFLPSVKPLISLPKQFEGINQICDDMSFE
jgi:hypothetical protein